MRSWCVWHVLYLVAVAWIAPVARAQQLWEVSKPHPRDICLKRTNGGGRLTRTGDTAQDDFDHDRFLVSAQVAQAAGQPTANISFQLSYRPEPDNATLQPLPRHAQKPARPPRHECPGPKVKPLQLIT